MIATLRVFVLGAGRDASAAPAVDAIARTSTQPNSDDVLLMVPFLLRRAFARPGNQRWSYRRIPSTAAEAAASPRSRSSPQCSPRCAADHLRGRALPGALPWRRIASG